jgi:hypothetical protein
MISGMDRDSLEAFRRQVEDDYRLDIAAIERLQRRFLEASNGIPGNPIPVPGNSVPSNIVPTNIVPSNIVPTSVVPNGSVPGRSVPGSFDSSPNAGASGEWRTEQRPAGFQPSAPAEPKNDDLVDSLRTMFSSGRR